ncbi:MAG: PQQ-dependent sugar dehydrogenase [Myxococcales bacterium]|nr:PQQ-dependent sugar dehydrogenase [Myxococcales bacterium]
MRGRKVVGAALGFLVGGVVAFGIGSPPSCARPAAVTGAPALDPPVFEGLDAKRPRVAVDLVPVATGIDQPTDIQAVPGQPGTLAVLMKGGRAVRLAGGQVTPWFTVEVTDRSEMGLLGLAFHPRYAENRRFFLNYSPAGARQTRVEEWLDGSTPKPVRVLLTVEQPYANHDAGQLAFGPDGFLYIGLGDGGAADDPHGHGQDLKTLLGSMLRIDVEPRDGQPYGVPPDNPFVGRADARPEIWAYGLRNPWRYGFAPDGRLVVADVGQNLFEEVTVVGRGENHGWNRREADHCFPPGQACDATGLVDPVYTYTHAEDGSSITGGAVYTRTDIPDLQGKYVFGDFATGRLWAIDLPRDRAPVAPEKATALGGWPINPSTFGVGHDGTLYVGDFRGQRILKLVRSAR